MGIITATFKINNVIMARRDGDCRNFVREGARRECTRRTLYPSFSKDRNVNLERFLCEQEILFRFSHILSFFAKSCMEKDRPIKNEKQNGPKTLIIFNHDINDKTEINFDL